MKAREIYQNSINTIKKQIVDLTDEIHNLRKVKNDMYEMLINIPNGLNQINVKMDYIKKIQFDPSKEGSINIILNSENMLLDLTIKEIYIKYINISNSLITKCKLYNLLCNLVKIDYDSYYYILDALGTYISKGILLGDKFVFHKRLGSIVITRFPRKESKKVVDWDKSNKKKKELIEQGIKPKHNNDDGVEWIVYRDDDSYLGFNWDRAGITAKNGVYYSFKATSFINTANRINDDIIKMCSTINATLTCSEIGNIQKMLHLATIDPKINQIYSHGL